MFRLRKIEKYQEQLFVFILACVDSSLHAQTCSGVHSLDSCIRRLFIRECICSSVYASVGSILRRRAKFCICRVFLA